LTKPSIEAKGNSSPVWSLSLGTSSAENRSPVPISGSDPAIASTRGSLLIISLCFWAVLESIFRAKSHFVLDSTL
jgi:hypothetical protein